MEGTKPSPTLLTTSPAARDRDWERRLLWLLVLAVFGLLTYFYVQGQTDRKIRDYVLQKLRDRFPSLIVNLDRAHLDQPDALLLEGLRIYVVTTEGVRPLVKCQRIVAQGKLDWMNLVRGEIDIDRVTVEGAELSVWPVSSEGWSFGYLTGAPMKCVSLPEIDFLNGMIRIGQASKEASELILHDVNLAMRVKEQETDSGTAPVIDVSCSAAASQFHELKLNALSALDFSTWVVQGYCTNIQFSDRLMELWPNVREELACVLRGVRCESDVQFSAIRPPQSTMQYQLVGVLRKGRIEHPELRYLLENVQGEFAIRDGAIQFRKLEGRNGASQFFCEADVYPFGESPRGYARASVRGLQLDDRLRSSLPPLLQKHWSNFQPTGSIDADLELRLENGVWKPQAEFVCQDVSIEHTAFPARVRQLSGRLRFDGERLVGKGLSATLRGQVIRGDIVLEKSEPKWAMDLSMYSEGPIAIQEDILAALSPRDQPDSKLEKFIRSLQPIGSVQLDRARFVRRAEDLNRVDKALELSIYNGTVRFEPFRYPIFEIQGRVIVDNDWIQIQDLHGRNDSARIHCDGNCLLVPGGVEQMQLQFECFSVPLEEELYRALPNPIANLWDQIQPAGVLDRVQVHLHKKTLAQQMDLHVAVQSDGSQDRPSAYSVSVRPKILPIPLSDIRCHLDYRPDRLSILHMSGLRGNSRVHLEGSCRLRPQGAWEATISWLPGSRVVVDQSLVANLPPKLQLPFSSSGFQGPVNVTGWTYFINEASSAQPYVSAWDLRMQVEDGQLLDGSVVRGIRGSIRMEGEATREEPTATGMIELDSLAISNVPMLGVRGPFAWRGGQILLGREAHRVVLDRKQPINLVDSAIRFGTIIPALATDAAVASSDAAWISSQPRDPPSLSSAVMANRESSYLETQDGPPSDIIGRFGGGKMLVHGVGQLQSGRFQLQVGLAGSNLKELLQELNQPPANVTGRLDADLVISGSPSNIQTWTGKGKVAIRDAQLYELPWMAKFLRLMSVRSPDDSAFESADIEFRLDGDRIPLERLSLDGDIISLRGNGWANLRKELHLDLYTYVGKKGMLAAFMGPIVNHSDATLMYIEVDGTTDQFAIQKKLPMLESTLEQVFPEKANLPANERKNIR